MRQWRRAEVLVKYSIPTPHTAHIAGAAAERWVLLKDLVAELHGWAKLCQYIASHKPQLADNGRDG